MSFDATQMRRVALAGISADPDWSATQTTPDGSAIQLQDVQDSGDFEVVCVNSAGASVNRGSLVLTLQPIVERTLRDAGADANRTFYSALDSTKSTDIKPYSSMIEDDISAGTPLFMRIAAVTGAADASATHVEVWGRGTKNKGSLK